MGIKRDTENGKRAADKNDHVVQNSTDEAREIQRGDDCRAGNKRDHLRKM